jgi:putative transposase
MGRRGRQNLADEHFFFVTTTIVHFVNIFSDYRFFQILIDNIKHYQKKYKFKVIAYVIMPSHFHWIVEVNPKYGTISDIMRDLKKYSAWDILEEIDKTDNHLSKIFKAAAVGYPNQKRKLWMPRFDDEVIRNEKMFWTKLHYIHNNPIEAGLVRRAEKYKYSSARNYKSGDHSILEVDVSLAGIEMK